jgi:hypothetical protein
LVPATVQPPVVVEPVLVAASLRVLRGNTVVAALSPNGTITFDGTVSAHLTNDRIVSTSETVLARVENHHVIFSATPGETTLNADGSMSSQDGDRMGISSDGHVTFTHATEVLTTETHVEGVTDASRTTATILVAVWMFHTRTSH